MARRHQMRQLARDTWLHAWRAYMTTAFPEDELLPLSCKGQGPDRADPGNWDYNDVLGDYSLTLVDAMPAFALMRDPEGFSSAVRDVIRYVSFDRDARVQVFEVTIRVLGGLLSGHMWATDRKRGFHLPWYQGQLLTLARDLGNRLLPAFAPNVTGSGIPIARVHLQKGVLPYETVDTCTAGGGSLLLEFAALSRLTGDPVYERVAKKSFYALWNARSDLNLVGNNVNAHTAAWVTPYSSIGAGIDSFYEYMVKSFVALDEDAFWRVWETAYGALRTHVRAPDGFVFRNVDMNTGVPITLFVDSLSSFFPGLQVLAGDIDGAIRSHMVFANLWERYSGLPELFSLATRSVESPGYPLRPELIESTHFLYQATRDPHYLRFGERMLLDIVNRTTVPCGAASLDNVETGKLSDRMHSFFLAETLPYMFMLFDDRENPISRDDSSSVFTTEGHMLLPLPTNRTAMTSRATRKTAVCAAHAPTAQGAYPTHWTELALGAAHRVDAEYARTIVGLQLDEAEAIRTGLWSPFGTCKLANSAEPKSVDILFTTPQVSEDRTPSKDKVERISSAVLEVKRVWGLRFSLLKRVEPKDEPVSYSITQIGPHEVPSNSVVHISDPDIVRNVLPSARKELQDMGKADLEITLGSTRGSLNPVVAVSAAFGPDLLTALAQSPTIGQWLRRLDRRGCDPWKVVLPPGHYLLLLDRGGCDFATKSRHAKQAGFSALLVANDEDGPLFTPSGDDVGTSDSEFVPTALISKADGHRIRSALTRSPNVRVTNVRVKLESVPVVVNGLRLANAMIVT